MKFESWKNVRRIFSVFLLWILSAANANRPYRLQLNPQFNNSLCGLIRHAFVRTLLNSFGHTAQLDWLTQHTHVVCATQRVGVCGGGGGVFGGRARRLQPTAT